MSKRARLTMAAILKLNQLRFTHILTLIRFLDSNSKVHEKHFNYITIDVLHD